MADRSYTKDEADAILARAIELQGRGEATSHAELLATAREIGVAPEALERAAADVLAGRRDDQELRALRAGRWRGFFAHLVPFVSVGVLLGFINYLTGGFPWAVIPMLAWGVGLASHLFAVAMPDDEALRTQIAGRRERRRAGRGEGTVRVAAQASGSAKLRVEPGAAAGAPGEAEYEEDESEAQERNARG